MKTNVILNGDALGHLKEMQSECVNCVMTSPPYWALRDYGVSGQIGLEENFENYISNLCDIFDEIKRVLKKDGTCWVNIGDTYFGGGRGHTTKDDNSIWKGGKIQRGNKGSYVKAPWMRPSREEYMKGTISKKCLLCKEEFKGKESSQFCSRKCLNKKGNNFRSQNRSMPNKCLCLIPFRFVIEMVNRGWILRNTIIWHKPNCMPSSVKDRFTVDFEYLFFFTKSGKYWFQTQREPHKTEFMPFNLRVRDSKKGYKKSDQYKASEEEMLQYDTQGVRIEYKGKFRGMKNHEDFGSPRARHERHKDPFKAWHPKGRNKRAVWKIPTAPYPEAHFAVYPEAICETPIRAGCPEGGIVLDPFFGSGTTGLVALKQNKKFLGIELNPEYIKIANKRLKPYLQQRKLII